MDYEEDEAVQTMTEAITHRCKAAEEYVQLIHHYGPALKGTMYWTNNKTIKTVNELLTISDEAFIAICIINYGGHWKQEWEIKQGLQDEEDDMVAFIVSKQLLPCFLYFVSGM
jgi:hypothetical protein